MDPITAAMWGNAASNAIGGGLGYLFNQNPAEAAMPYLEGFQGAISPYFDPYMQAGQRSLGTLEQQFNQLLNNPQAIMQMLGGGFQQSPGYQFQYDQAMNAANAANAAGGTLGSSAHQQQAGTMASNLANQDYYNYLDRMFGLFNTGLSGHQNLNTMGYGASSNMANLMSQNIWKQAEMAMKAAEAKNDATGGLLGSIF